MATATTSLHLSLGLELPWGKGMGNLGFGKGLGNGAANGKQLQALPLSELPLLAPQLNHKLHVLRTWIRTQVLLSNGVPPPPLPVLPLLRSHSFHPTSASCYTEF